jgi:eukaryotic-like serine/threonine-protein kinase
MGDVTGSSTPAAVGSGVPRSRDRTPPTLGRVDVLAGRYELGEPLGGGGTSWVVAGRDRVLTRAVAVKLLAPGCPPAVRARFQREGRTAARVAHRNVVAIYDVGEDAGRAYLVMELVDGGDVASRLAAQGRLPVPDVLRICDQALAALEALHGLGIVHRDLKPANLLLTRDGTVKVTDFGIARFEGATSLTTGSILGTPAYLPPEQAEGRAPTAAGDLYSLGVVCFEMLAGAPPFHEGGPAAVALAHVHEPLPRLADRRDDLPPALVSVVERALEKDPSRRWPDAATMRAALAAVGAGDSGPLARGDGSARTQPSAVGATISTLPPTQRYPAVAVLPPTPRPLAPAPRAAAPARPPFTPTPPAPPPGGAAPRAPRPDAPRGRPRRRRRWVVPALVAIAAAALAAVVASGLFDDGTPTAGTDATTTQPTATSATTATTSTDTTVPTTSTTSAPAPTTAPTTTTPTTSAPTPPSTLPSSLEELIALLAEEPGIAGERGEDLLDRLDDVQRRDGNRQRARAEDALDDIDEWVDDGELDPTFAAAARAVLEPLASSGSDGSDDDED